MSTTRRFFLLAISAGGSGLSLSASAQSMVDEKSPQAAALGYVEDATKADTKRFPKYAAGQMCGSCALFQGKASDASGPCPLFAGKQVNAKGWCSAWAKRG